MFDRKIRFLTVRFRNASGSKTGSAIAEVEGDAKMAVLPRLPQLDCQELSIIVIADAVCK